MPSFRLFVFNIELMKVKTLPYLTSCRFLLFGFFFIADFHRKNTIMYGNQLYSLITHQFTKCYYIQLESNPIKSNQIRSGLCFMIIFCLVLFVVVVVVVMSVC